MAIKNIHTVENYILDVTKELFSNKQVDRETDFFALGGNSLTVIRFISRIEEKFGEDVISPVDIYANGKLGHIASVVFSEAKVMNS